MFDFGNANTGQKRAITAVNGPVLIIAGPGTGKTFTLVQRAVYMIQEKGVKPEQILIATFTDKAAKELVTRITNELLERNIAVNIKEMYIGTFHSICLRFIKEHIEYTRIRKNYRTLDDFDQTYTAFQNISRFRNIENFDIAITVKGAWRQSQEICRYVNNLSEELILADDLKGDDDPAISALGDILSVYNCILNTNNIIDFAGIQTEAYYLLKTNPEVLEELQSKIKYLMIDEYQDTNFIQEQIVFTLAGKEENICVVGDDDQGLYRFRGATIRNILEFPTKFTEKDCKVIPLTINYRSNSEIVGFYNKWMTTTSGAKFRFDWDKYRFDKRIIASKSSQLNGSAVIKISAEDDEDEWHESILHFINTLKDCGKLKDLNQIAFLFQSVRNQKALDLARYLEKNGVNVYSPRSDMFFERGEVKLILGALLLTFPQYVARLEQRNFDFTDENLCQYYESCIRTLNDYLQKNECRPLLTWIRGRGKTHFNLTKNTDYGLTGLIYQMFEFAPFTSILDTELGSGVIDLRPARNIAKLTEIIGKYEYLHRVEVLTPKKIEKDIILFFNMYLRFLFNGGIDEYEDDSEYAPSGCVSFLTIHQSKGMEFPIVIVGSLSNNPRNRHDNILTEITEKYHKRPSYEPLDRIKYYDFWRLYYTAFSRAQNLLVLTANEKTREPSKYFSECYSSLKSNTDSAFNIQEFDFEEIKNVNIKEVYSFTSHISVYETCSLQYKFFKELGFTPIRVGATLFGQLVHQTIEDIHRAALRKEAHLITNNNIQQWLLSNYTTLSKSEHTYLGEPQIMAALKQVCRYAERQNGDWSRIQEAEVEVSLLKQDYIIEGTIDLIRGEGDTVELVDFKSEKKPDIFKDVEKLEHYRKQLQVYAHLVEKKTGHTVSKLHIYYTGEEDSNPQITFPSNRGAIDSTIQEFDNIVQKIKKKDFCTKATSQITCNNCDFRFYCKN
ncbi:DNA helicase-2/ATP-dependent DNA helicase PcrA [Hydrogenoanaerobacterium saccharovorans]|uniref:DNA 3'-5' helicase n=1 Tax=Hydrogenoanaerobacterium saccharovorans TaxID=474960 RepID=A0A1H8A1C9_9FIRM|nr:ATP-dependent DNA helicase [Hydrogenoanaerobacterium saccharovorans]RPF48280.1 DNA helicase-2/ATP-dependent DNA helicase PcrA [Hydrogenoanaerobacterium saccharovorans]SEM63599.1 DNA helicase-2 / ATP-dependent DNA helicase PcrA [Hydrogenoanaerobacterium saccharovorans]